MDTLGCSYFWKRKVGSCTSSSCSIGTVYVYGGIGYFLDHQNWILYMYGIIESRYGYNGIGFFSGKLKLDGFIGTGYGYNGIGFFV